MAWAPACQQNLCKPFENPAICFPFLREGNNIYRSLVLWKLIGFSLKYVLWSVDWMCIFPPHKIPDGDAEDGMLITEWSPRRNILCFYTRNMPAGSESGSKQFLSFHWTPSFLPLLDFKVLILNQELKTPGELANPEEPFPWGAAGGRCLRKASRTRVANL